MELDQAIRERRTHKVYGSDPVDRQTLEELFELARWAPNHHLTQPWRFRVLGPRAIERLKDSAGPEAAVKLDRAPTLVCASVVLDGSDPMRDEEDLCATACAVYAMLLGAHARGLAGYWRTPGVLRTPDGAAALGMAKDELFVALIHLGPARQIQQPPQRQPPTDFVTYLE